MRHIQGENRQQMVLFPESLDKYVPDDSQVRFIDGFVDSLDLVSLGYTKAQTKRTGRKPYNPGDLLKLFLYGYLHRIRSSRGLEKETRRNIEVIWLINRLHPDFKTIADFRRDNSCAIGRTFKEFVRVCKHAGLYKGELLAVDGSMFKAVNSKDRMLVRKKLELQLSDIDRDIEKYLEEMERLDEEEDALYGDNESFSPERLKQILEDLKRKKREKKSQLDDLDESGERQKALTDSDARLMKKHGKETVVGYNVQSVVDDKHKMIVAYEVTNAANDKDQLVPMARKAMEHLEVDRVRVVADSGYYNGEQISQASKLGVETFIPTINTSTNKHHGRYDKTRFAYDNEKDCYYCPAGKALKKTYIERKNARSKAHYKTGECRSCSCWHLCTTNKRGRIIYRYEDEEAVEALRRRNKDYPEMQKKRKALVEHPFGTLKRNWGYDHFLMKGKEKVRGEVGLMLLAYNIKRVMTTFGAEARDLLWQQ